MDFCLFEYFKCLKPLSMIDLSLDRFCLDSLSGEKVEEILVRKLVVYLTGKEINL